MFELIVFFGLLAICSGQYLAARPLPFAARPLAVATHAVATDDYDPHPRYSFSYNINDPITGDFKSQTENRDGNNVQGSYTLAEPDGSLRTVDYTADSVNGFNAAVHKTPGGHATPIAVAPAVRTVSRPLALAAAPSVAAAPAVLQSAYTAPHVSYTL